MSLGAITRDDLLESTSHLSFTILNHGEHLEEARGRAVVVSHLRPGRFSALPKHPVQTRKNH
jgi:hypothetical protein